MAINAHGLPRRAFRRVLIAGIRFVQAHDGIRHLAHWVLGRMPRLQRRFFAFAAYNARFINSSESAGRSGLGPDFAHAEPSPDTSVIYARMRRMAVKPQKPSGR